MKERDEGRIEMLGGPEDGRLIGQEFVSYLNCKLKVEGHADIPVMLHLDDAAELEEGAEVEFTLLGFYVRETLDGVAEMPDASAELQERGLTV